MMGGEIVMGSSPRVELVMPTRQKSSGFTVFGGGMTWQAIVKQNTTTTVRLPLGMLQS
jgi:hypothetical protein